MTFESLKVNELKKIAEDFAVATDGLKNKSEIIAALAEEGVTYSVYAKTLDQVEEESEILGRKFFLSLILKKISLRIMY